MIIGLTGGSGAGKSFIAEIFAKHGFIVIDADKIAKEIMLNDMELKEKIRENFGDEFINSDGEVDRKALGEVIFADKAKRELLNSLTHPKIVSEISNRAKNHNGNSVLDVPLLVGGPLENLCDFTVSVIADRENRIERIIKRDGISRENAENRINSQMNDDEFIKYTDVHIINNGNENDLECQITKIIERYCK